MIKYGSIISKTLKITVPIAVVLGLTRFLFRRSRMSNVVVSLSANVGSHMTAREDGYLVIDHQSFSKLELKATNGPTSSTDRCPSEIHSRLTAEVGQSLHSLMRLTRVREHVDLLIVSERTTSTQTEIDKFDPLEGHLNVLFVGLTQTMGRGRNENKWTSGVGDVSMTVSFRLEGVHDRLLMSFLAAVSAHKCLRRYNSECGMTIKWPNDILVDNQKVFGTLVEGTEPCPTLLNHCIHPNDNDDGLHPVSQGTESRIDSSVIRYKIGIGINLTDKDNYKGIVGLMKIENHGSLREEIIDGIIGELFGSLWRTDEKGFAASIVDYVDRHLHQKGLSYAVTDWKTNETKELSIAGVNPTDYNLIGIDDQNRKYSIRCRGDSFRDLRHADLVQL